MPVLRHRRTLLASSPGGMPPAPAAGDAHAETDSPSVTATGNPSMVAETRRLYAADWDSFAHWRQDHAMLAFLHSAEAAAVSFGSLAVTHRPGSSLTSAVPVVVAGLAV